MSNLTVQVGILGGTDIKDAITEAKELAIKLSVAFVTFNFNRQKLSISQTCDINLAIDEYKAGKEYIVQ